MELIQKLPDKKTIDEIRKYVHEIKSFEDIVVEHFIEQYASFINKLYSTFDYTTMELSKYVLSNIDIDKDKLTVTCTINHKYVIISGKYEFDTFKKYDFDKIKLAKKVITDIENELVRKFASMIGYTFIGNKILKQDNKGHFHDVVMIDDCVNHDRYYISFE